MYAQVFAQAAGRRGILDLLAVTRTRRLVIRELKTAENPDLPLQAAEYWSRIRRHEVPGDLARYGYFPGFEPQSAPALHLSGGACAALSSQRGCVAAVSFPGNRGSPHRVGGELAKGSAGGNAPVNSLPCMEFTVESV